MISCDTASFHLLRLSRKLQNANDQLTSDYGRNNALCFSWFMTKRLAFSPWKKTSCSIRHDNKKRHTGVRILMSRIIHCVSTCNNGTLAGHSFYTQTVNNSYNQLIKAVFRQTYNFWNPSSRPSGFQKCMGWPTLWGVLPAFPRLIKAISRKILSLMQK